MFGEAMLVGAFVTVDLMEQMIEYINAYSVKATS